MVAFVCILSDSERATCVEMTLSLRRTMWGHKVADDSAPAFDRLVYFERCKSILDAHQRREQLGHMAGSDRDGLVERRNPDWDDLSRSWFPLNTRAGVGSPS